MTADRFADTIADTLFGPDQQTGRHLMRTAVHLLAHGKPVTITELATAAGVEVGDLTNAPAGQDIEYDDQHRIIGWGLTLNPTPHTYIVDGHHLYTWCAADTLLFPAILGRPAQIESRCPTTDTVIHLTVDPPAGVTELSPDTAVISIPGSQEMDTNRVRATTCNPAASSPPPRPPKTGSVRTPTEQCYLLPMPTHNCAPSATSSSTNPNANPLTAKLSIRDGCVPQIATVTPRSS